VLPLLILGGCKAQKSANPLSPSVAGPIPGVTISAPILLEPGAGWKYKADAQPLRLLIENASSTGVRPLSYVFEVASDESFSNRIFTHEGVVPGDGGRTSLTLPTRLADGRVYYWRARAQDGANTGPFANPVGFEILPPVIIHPPVALAPSGNERVTTMRPTLRVRNADRSGPAKAMYYHFQIALDQAFTQVVASDTRSEGSDETWYPIEQDLQLDKAHFWRARATDEDVTSDWSSTEVFRTPLSPPPPPPGGGGSGGGPPCGPPYPSTGEAVVACVAAQYPDRLVAGVSLGQRTANMEFLRDRVIETGICGGMDLAWNRKRGNGPHSIDAIAWRVNGRDEVVDIGVAYDDTSRPLALSWGIVEGPPGYDPYQPRPTCR
jgi:hypothetical protein